MVAGVVESGAPGGVEQRFEGGWFAEGHEGIASFIDRELKSLFSDRPLEGF